MSFFDAIILGIIEGLTEFLPISSTAHILIGAYFLNLDNNAQFFQGFVVAVQFGSILAILVLFWKRFCSGFPFLLKLAVAFLPTGVLGLLFHKIIALLLSVHTAAFMLIIGGVVFILTEYKYKNKDFKTHTIHDITLKQAFLIGCFQSLAMIPGTSRSGATIIGGLLLGLSRKNATEFSFLLAFPTMTIATAFSLYKSHDIIAMEHIQLLLLGMFVAFVSALVIMKAFLSFIARFNFVCFGIYRIIVGLIFLCVFIY